MNQHCRGGFGERDDSDAFVHDQAIVTQARANLILPSYFTARLFTRIAIACSALFLLVNMTTAGPAAPSSEDRMKAFESVPLFMTKLPDASEETDDAALQALQALIHEGTPDGV